MSMQISPIDGYQDTLETEIAEKAKKLLLGIHIEDEIKGFVEQVLHHYYGEMRTRENFDKIQTIINNKLKEFLNNNEIYDYKVNYIINDNYEATFNVAFKEVSYSESMVMNFTIK